LIDWPVCFKAPPRKLWLTAFGQSGGGISAAFRMDPHFVRQYDEHFNKVNVFFKRPSDATRVGRVYTGEMLCSSGELERSEYYNDFFRKLGVFHALGGTLREADQGIPFISCLRSRRAGPFREEEARVLRALVPHLRRVIHIHGSVCAIDQSAIETMDVLERLGIGCIVLDRIGRCALVNESAQRIIAAVDGLTITAQGVCASRLAETLTLTLVLHAAIERTFRLLQKQNVNGSGALRVSRPGRLPLEVLVTPLQTLDTNVPARHRTVALFVHDPERVGAPDLGALQQRYSLTATESAIAAALGDGSSLTQIADALRSRVATVRWHVKRVLAKMGAANQRDIVRTVLVHSPPSVAEATPSKWEVTRRRSKTSFAACLCPVLMAALTKPYRIPLAG
jgi:DNA-binding CsgD family transcriptional regulator